VDATAFARGGEKAAGGVYVILVTPTTRNVTTRARGIFVEFAANLLCVSKF
jgi:hypothetical protein